MSISAQELGLHTCFRRWELPQFNQVAAKLKQGEAPNTPSIEFTDVQLLPWKQNEWIRQHMNRQMMPSAAVRGRAREITPGKAGAIHKGAKLENWVSKSTLRLKSVNAMTTILIILSHPFYRWASRRSWTGKCSFYMDLWLHICMCLLAPFTQWH